MCSEVRRGYVPEDLQQFNNESLDVLKKAQEEILYLVERGYRVKGASTFVGNHYLLSERQRLAIVRATADRRTIHKRLERQVTKQVEGEEVFIDGLNLIITLEVALSDATLIKCMDGTIRDLAGLRGTYRLIDKTTDAVILIGDKLAELKAAKATFYLDAPVSNTGRLKQRILELLAEYPFSVSVELVSSPDVILSKQKNVVTSDAIVLNQCESWLNFAAEIIEQRLPKVNCINLG